ncbi:hypothetical protein [Pseudomonas sp. Teo4]|nr:hypothetical protein [Pseudomonas sp. Teo4]
MQKALATIGVSCTLHDAGQLSLRKLLNQQAPLQEIDWYRHCIVLAHNPVGRKAMRSILLWMIGVPIPVIILIWFFMH